MAHLTAISRMNPHAPQYQAAAAAPRGFKGAGHLSRGSAFCRALPRLAASLPSVPRAVPGKAQAEAEEFFYQETGLEMAAHRRKDKAWMEEAFASPEALLAPVWKGKCLVEDSPDGPKAVLLPLREFEGKRANPTGTIVRGTVFLGLRRDTGAPVFAARLRSESDVESLKYGTLDETRSEERPPYDTLHGHGGAARRFVDVRSEGPTLPVSEAGTLGYGSGLLAWHEGTRFCAKCGGEVAASDGGHRLRCSADGCRTSFRPPVDPAVIMLVTCGDFALLGRNKRWPPGRFSVLAGFCEAGETLEAAVAREVVEESGVVVDPSNVAYYSSNPWPFPQSLMVGFRAEVPGDEPSAERSSQGLAPSFSRDDSDLAAAPESDLAMRRRLREDGGAMQAWEGPAAPPPRPAADEIELADVRWVHRDWLRAATGVPRHFTEEVIPRGAVADAVALGEANEFSMPGRYSIARRMLDDWMGLGPRGAAPGDEPPAEWGGDFVADVDIDTGVFKYVLIRVSDGEGRSKVIVRGDSRAGYHNDVFQRTRRELNYLGLALEPLGGGRIEHWPQQKVCHIYGYSVAFGQAQHAATKALVDRWYPLYDSVTWSNEGY